MLLVFVLSSGEVFADGLETKGTIVIAKTEGSALVLWDITPAVASLVAKGGSENDKMIPLEIAASKILLTRLDDLPSSSTITVRVLYQKTGEVSPIYRTATFQGVERVIEVTASRAAAQGNKSAWESDLARGRLPPGIVAKVTGALPPA